MTTEPTTTEPAPKTDDTEGLKKALQSEREARKTAEKQAREATDRLTELESANLRSKVAASKGLTADQAEFLTGSTEEEMAAAADKLKESFKTEPDAPKKGLTRQPVTDLKGGSDPTDEPTDSHDDIAARIVGG